MTTKSHELIALYYDAFNQQDMNLFFSLLADDVVHDINQGETQYGTLTSTGCKPRVDYF